MFRKLTHIVAAITFVLGIFGLSYTAWDGTSMARLTTSVVQPAGTVTVPSKTHASAPAVHPAIGETPTFLEARRYITPYLELDMPKLDA